jgi:uncharacterized lipoprotein YmbA
MRNALPALVLGALLLAACGTTPPSRLYTLGTEAVAGDRVAGNAELRRIELVSVRIPELWDRPQIVLTKSANEVGISEFHRWAAPLKSEVPRVVARDLRRLLGTPDVWLRDDFAGAKPDLRVQVTIERIDAVAGQGIQLDAAWAIRPVSGDVAAVGRTTIIEPISGTGYETVVTALRSALLRMSAALAKDIATVPGGGGGR